MKKAIFQHLITLSLILLICLPAFAQKDKVDYKDDMIWVNGKAFAKMERKVRGLAWYDYSISGLTGPELIFIKTFRGQDVWDNQMNRMTETWWQDVNFIGSGGKATVRSKMGEGVAKMIVENKLIAGNAIDYEAERRFIQLNNGYYPQPVVNEQAASPTVVVNVAGNPSETAAASAPKSKTPVTLEGNEIKREGATIGKFREEITNSNFSQKTRILTIYNGSGEKVAEAFVPFENPQEWTVRTLGDGKQVPLLYDAPGEKEKVFKWLADKGYLGE